MTLNVNVEMLIDDIDMPIFFLVLFYNMTMVTRCLESELYKKMNLLKIIKYKNN